MKFRRIFSLSAIASLAWLATTVAPAAVRSELSEQTQTASLALEASSAPTREVLGVAFKSPEGFSEVRELGRRTTGIVYPETATESPHMMVRFAELESDSESWVKISPSEQMMLAKYLFLGNNSPAGDYSQRTFFGKPLAGEAQTIRTRDGYRYIELFVVPLEKSERKIAIAFESDTRLPLVTVETAINTVTESLQELDQSAKKKSKKSP
jgi:hypothetical protein